MGTNLIEGFSAKFTVKRVTPHQGRVITVAHRRNDFIKDVVIEGGLVSINRLQCFGERHSSDCIGRQPVGGEFLNSEYGLCGTHEEIAIPHEWKPEDLKFEPLPLLAKTHHRNRSFNARLRSVYPWQHPRVRSMEMSELMHQRRFELGDREKLYKRKADSHDASAAEAHKSASLYDPDPDLRCQINFVRCLLSNPQGKLIQGFK